MKAKKSTSKAKTKPKRKAAAKPKPKPKPKVKAKARRRVARKPVSKLQPAVPRASQVLWSTGLLGGIMVITAALWSVWRGPPPDITASASMRAPASLPASAPAPQAPPRPAQVERPLPDAAPQTGQQQRGTTQLERRFDEAAKKPVGERVSYWSDWLAHERVAREELAAIEPRPANDDIVPLVPTEFDCTTFVETVAALARSRAQRDFYARLLELRYRGEKASYLSRKHFPELDWLPGNIANGALTDMTEKVARESGITLAFESKSIDRASWLAQQMKDSPDVARVVAREGPPGPEWSGTRETRVAYIPARELARAMEKIPDGAVINFVRKNSLKRPVLITHQGILVRLGGVLLMRHASSGSRVRTSVLRDYLRKNARLAGFTLAVIN